jgi:hypothetical protein
MKNSKTKLLAIIVAAVLVLIIIPATALAAPADPYEGPTFIFSNGTGSQCIEGYGGTNTINTGVIDLWGWWNPVGSTSQHYYLWKLVPDANHEYFQIRRITSSTTYAVGNALAPNASMRLRLSTPSNTVDNQWWKLERQSNNRFIITNKAYPTLCIAPVGGATANQTELDLLALTATNNAWTIAQHTPTSSTRPTTSAEFPVASAAAQAALSVPVGTAVDALGLPATVNVTFTNDTGGIAKATWNTTPYNGSVPGVYTLVGTLQVNGLATNPNNVTASIAVTVEGEGGGDTYTISASALTPFGSVTGASYTPPAAQTVTVTNTGTGAVTLTQPTSANYTIGALSTTTLATTGATATFTVQPKAGLAVGSYNEAIGIPGSNGAVTSVSASFTVDTDAPANQPVVEEVRIISSNMIELHWKVHTKYTGSQVAYRYSDGHPDTLMGAGSSLNFNRNQTTDRNNFEIKLNGSVLSQPTSTANSCSPFYWHADNYLLHQVRMNQHVTTLRLSTALTSAQQTALQNGSSAITVQIVGNVTNRAGTAADKTIVYTAIWKPYYDKQVVATTGLTIKGSQFVDLRTVQKAADITDIIMSAMPEAVVRQISSQGAFLLFGPGEHSGNIPEQRSVICYDEFNRAEGYGGANAATSAANVERCNVSGSGNTAPYYPTGYRSGYQNESILAHEFGHKIQTAFNSVYTASNPLRAEFIAAHQNGRSRTMFTPYMRDSSSGNGNNDEYFATMVAIWYNAMSEGNAANCNTRDELFRYDRKLYDFAAKILSSDNLILSPDWSNCPNTAAPNYTTGDPDPFPTYTKLPLSYGYTPYLNDPSVRLISTIAPQTGYSVPMGTPISAIELPAKVKVAYTDSFSVSPFSWTAPFGLDYLPVNWDSSTYNGNIPGTYIVEGTPHATYTGRYTGLPYFTNVIASPDNVKAKVEIIVQGALDNNADLATLALSAGTLTPAFSADVTSYTASVANSVSSITITATAASAAATVEGADAKTLVVGANPFTLTVTAEDKTVKTYTITVTRDVPPANQPVVEEVRIISSNMIELHWKVHTKYTGSQAAYRYSDGHPDTLMGAGSSLNFNRSQTTDRNNFEIKLNGSVLSQPASSTQNCSPFYWHADNYLLHQVRMNQHVTTLRLSTALTTAQQTALQNGTSTITVQIVGNVTNRAGTAADKDKIYTAIWRPYYPADRTIIGKSGLRIKGSEFVDRRTVEKAADITDLIMSAMPQAVVNRISAAGDFCIFGPGEHSGNIPEQRGVISYDEFNRAEGYGGATAATSAANVERCNVAVGGVTLNTAPYYPAGYRSGYQHESILAHEFGHKIHTAFNAEYATTHPLRQEFTAAFANVTSRVMWTAYVRDTASGGEYIATLTSVWYNGMSEGNAANCNTRDELYRYDRKGYDFFSKLYSVDNIILSPDWSNCPNTAAPNYTTGDANPFATPQTRALSAIAPQVGVSVPFGTAISDITLPAKVQVAFSNSFSTSPFSWTLPYGLDYYPVTWDTSAYNGNVPGTYIIEGAPHPTYIGRYTSQPYMTNVITNPDNLKATFEVIVEGVLVTDIIGVPTAGIAWTPVALGGTVIPENATNKGISWSIKDAGTTGATLEGNNLTAKAAGTVIVTATVKDGLLAGDFVKDFNIVMAPLEYTVTFVDYDGKVLKTQKVEHGANATAPASPVREGYNFTGWDKAFTNVTSDLTVTAMYTIKTYTVTFVDWDGKVLNTQTVEHGANATAPAAPVREGYNFTGWDKAFTNVTSDLTVTATYTIKTYTVTFVDWDGTELDAQTVEHGAGAIAPADPTRVAYIFTGWDTAFASVTGDLTVTAQYVAKSVEMLLEELGEYLRFGAETGLFDNNGSYQSLTSFLKNAEKQLEMGKIDNAIKQLENIVDSLTKDADKKVDADFANTAIEMIGIIFERL